MIRTCAWLALILMLSAAASPAAPIVIISGLVVGKDGGPVRGARIALYTANAAPSVPPITEAQTLDNGSFILQVTSPGRYHLSIQKDGFNSSEQDLDVPPQGSAGLKLMIESLPILQLRLVRPDGTPAPQGKSGVWMLIRRRSDLAVSSGVWAAEPVAADGTLEIQDHAGKTEDDIKRIDVMVREAGVGSGRAFFDGWPSTRQTIKLQPGVSLTVHVVDAAGHPAAKAAVRVNGMDLSLEKRFLQGEADTDTDAAGKAIIPSLLPGRYDIAAYIGVGGVDHRQKITLGDQPAAAVITPVDRTQPDTNFMDRHAPWWAPADSGEMPVAWDPPPGDTLSAPAQLHGTVKSESTGAPIQGMPVAIFQEYGRSITQEPIDVGVSRADGSFTLEAPAAVVYDVGVIAYDKYIAHFNAVHVGAVTPGSLDLVLPPYPELRLRLLTSDGRPAPAASYQVYMTFESPAGDNSHFFQEHTSRAGELLELEMIEPLPREPHKFCLVLQSPTTGFAEYRFDHWPRKPVDITLDKYTLTGRVLDASGRPVTGAVVTASRVLVMDKSFEYEGFASTTTDGNGEFTLASIGRGIWVIHAQPPHANGQSTFVNVSTDQSNITFRLPAGLVLTGKVIGRDGQPAANAYVTLYSGGRASARAVDDIGSVRSGPDGAFEIDSIPSAGDYLIIANLRDGFTPAKVVTLFQPKTSVILKAADQP